MTTTRERGRPGVRERVGGLLRGGTGIAVAIVVMNIATYAFQMVAARLLGPADYGGVASLMALLLVVAVVQLGLQATAARRVAATPEHVAQIERVMLTVANRAALGTGLLLLLLSPVVAVVLRLESIVPALLVALAAVPMTAVGGQCGVLQGERRWLALGAVYLALGLSRVLVGTLAILVTPTETGAMVGVAISMLAPAAVGWWALRHGRTAAVTSAANRIGPSTREALRASVALLAFYALSNADIVIARNVLDDYEAGLYAGGLIVTKAVLFLPQFVVVVAFPAMSSASERRRTLLRSIAAVLLLGVGAVAGARLLSDLALIFIGGDDYADVASRLWAFAALGTLLSLLQLLVYSVLARQGTRSTHLPWLAVAGILVGGAFVESLTDLVTLVACVDAVLVTALLGLSLYRLRDDVPAAGAQ